MRDVLYMAWRYLAYNRFKTAILVLSIALIIFIPVGLRVLVIQGERQLTARAEATPLLVGADGSPLELVLNSLYFDADVPERIEYREVQRVASSELADPIPLYIRFRVQDRPIVGTSMDYFEFRGLQIADGRQMTRLGECVVGAEVAKRRGVGPGDHVISSPENVFDLAGVYPLKMPVTGVLAFSDTPDDGAIFVDVKTAWIIEGLAHGHEDLSRPQAASRVLRREGDNIIGNPSVVEYTEITDENIDSFHFHGDPAGFPITAVVGVPRDQKSAAILRGRYESAKDPRQILRPIEVMDELLGTILTVQTFVVAALVIVGLATLLSAMLVFLLSLRLRRREIETMMKIGAARRRVAAVLCSEVIGVFGAGVLLAAALTWMTRLYGAAAIRALILQ